MTKKIFSFLAATVLTTTALASAEGVSVSFLSLNGNRQTVLTRCGEQNGTGAAFLERDGSELYLKIRNARCATLKTNFGEYTLNGTGSTNRYIDVKIDQSKPGYHKLLLGSHKYLETDGQEGNGDIISIYVPTKAVFLDLSHDRDGVTKPFALANCGGSVQAKLQNNQINIVYRNMTTCSRFDILSNDGVSLSYKAKDLSESGSGSLTIPNKFMDQGSNTISIKFYQPWTGTYGLPVEDIVKVKFFAI